MKQKIKNNIARIIEKLVKLAIYKGCMLQDDVIEKLSSRVDVSTKHGGLKFFCPGQLPLWRANTFFEKEPETLEWIDSFEQDSIFLDIGANVGLYTLYAGLQGHKVFAIEPMADNFFILQKNINLNKQDKTIAYCACFYNENIIDTLKIRNAGFGQAENSFNEALGSFGENYEPLYNQGVIGVTLDYFSEKLGVPNYIKIDVDGHEFKVIEGALKTLANKKLKSILIELNEASDSYQNIFDILESHGFMLVRKESAEMFKKTKYKNFKNHIFVRNHSAQ